MLISSVQDPRLYHDEEFEGESFYTAALEFFCNRVASNHLVFTDTGGTIWRTIQERLRSRPNLQRIINTIPPSRIVKVPPNAEIRDRVVKWLDEPSATAVGMAADPALGVFVAAPFTLDAVAEEGLTLQNALTLKDYPNSSVGMRDGASSSRSLLDCGHQDVIDTVIRPTVRWARSVSVLDSHLARVVTNNEDNANSFVETLRRIYKAWDEADSSSAADARFNIISSDWRGGPLAARVAQDLSAALPFGRDPRIRISLRTVRDCQDNELFHDRFLLTSCGITLGFTRGFDLSSRSGKCRACSVFVVSPTAPSDIANRIVSSREVGRYPKR